MARIRSHGTEMTFPFTESGIKATLPIKALSQALQAHMAAVGTNPCQIPRRASVTSMISASLFAELNNAKLSESANVWSPSRSNARSWHTKCFAESSGHDVHTQSTKKAPALLVSNSRGDVSQDVA